jgi:hypothetical protein
MHLISLSSPALAIALIFSIWQRYFQFRLRQQRTLRERITYLLWVIAQQVEG